MEVQCFHGTHECIDSHRIGMVFLRRRSFSYLRYARYKGKHQSQYTGELRVLNHLEQAVIVTQKRLAIPFLIGDKIFAGNFPMERFLVQH